MKKGDSFLRGTIIEFESFGFDGQMEIYKMTHKAPENSFRGRINFEEWLEENGYVFNGMIDNGPNRSYTNGDKWVSITESIFEGGFYKRTICLDKGVDDE